MVIYLIFVVIIVLIFYILTILEYSSFVERCQMLKDLIRFCYPFLYYISLWLPAICVVFFTKTSTSGWGVLIMLLEYQFITSELKNNLLVRSEK
jgi:APA family basic amino acid/polyamine antiporter